MIKFTRLVDAYETDSDYSMKFKEFTAVRGSPCTFIYPGGVGSQRL